MPCINRPGGPAQVGDRSMKILQIMAGAPVGGAEAFFERLCIALHRAGETQQIALRKHADRAGLLRGAGLSVAEFEFGGMLDLITRRALTRLAGEFDPDVALAWMSRAASRMPDGPFVKAARMGGYYDLKYFRRCEYLIGNTKDICDYLIGAGWPAKKVQYLPNFVNDEAMPPQDRSTLQTPDDATLCLCLGRLHKNKGFDVAITALEELPGVYLWIAGEGPERAALEKLSKDLAVADRVRFLGWREDVPALLAAADIFVCSSRHEPLGNMVIEAWAHGTPVVACAAQGPSQLIEHGETGLMTAVDDAAALAGSIKALIQDRALGQTLAQAGADTFRRSFAEGHVVEQYQTFFDTIVKARRV